MVCALAILFVPDRITGGLKQYSDKELAAISDRYKNVKWQFWLWAIANIPILLIGTMGIFALQALHPEFVVGGALIHCWNTNCYRTALGIIDNLSSV